MNTWVATLVGMALLSLVCRPVAASETVTAEPSDNSYHFTTHYRVNIDAPADAVWPVLINLQAWMYEFELTTETGSPGEPGQVLNLYPGQDFKLQVIAAEPHRLLVLANLPLTFQGEFGTGVGVFTLHESNGRTEVSLTGSRRYTWQNEGQNPLQQRRTSADFQTQTRRTWQQFLARLKTLSEQQDL